MQKKTIYLSMETKVREYKAKLLLALYAVEHGYQVVFGSKYPMNAHINSFPQGIYIGTGVTKALGGDLIRAKKAGHKTASFDEEGLAYINPDVFIETRIKEDIIKEIDRFFTWGPRHSELVHKKDPSLTNYVSVGNMRLEMLKDKYHNLYKNAVNEIKQKYGDFILINTNLKVFNHVVGQEKLFENLRGTSMISNNEDEKFYTDRYEHQKIIFNSYKALIETLSEKVKPMSIIIRPHTSENKDTWLTLSASNVFVDNTGNVVPWILASNAVIQKNCTTSIETIYLNRPVITYSVKYDERFDNDITNRIGMVCHNEGEVLQALDKIRDNDFIDTQMQKDKDFLKGYVSNMENEHNVASSILDELDKINVPPINDSGNEHGTGYSVVSLIKQLKKALGRALRKNTAEHKLIKQKFPGLTLDEIKTDINNMTGVMQIPVQSIITRKIDDNLFHLTMH